MPLSGCPNWARWKRSGYWFWTWSSGRTLLSKIINFKNAANSFGNELVHPAGTAKKHRVASNSNWQLKWPLAPCPRANIYAMNFYSVDRITHCQDCSVHSDRLPKADTMSTSFFDGQQLYSRWLWRLEYDIRTNTLTYTLVEWLNIESFELRKWSLLDFDNEMELRWLIKRGNSCIKD